MSSESTEQAPTTVVEEAPAAETPAENVTVNGTNESAAENGSGESTTPTTPAAPAENEQPPKEMRAIVLSDFGGLKSVKILKKPEPTLAEGEVLIRVRACGLNFQDLMVRQGVAGSTPKTPFILGSECAGEVEQVGEGVEGFKVGDRVVALPEYGAWAELVAVPAKYVFAIPDDLSFSDAAGITMNYITAYILLFEMANLSPGKKVLLHSAGGSVGQAICQLSHTVSDVTVFGVCSKGKHEALKAANSPIDHLLERGSDYSGEVLKISPEGVDIVLDCLCGEECNRGCSLLKPMGKYILYGTSSVVTGETRSIFTAAKSWWCIDKISPLKLYEENKSLSGFNLRRLLYKQDGTVYVHRAMEQVFKLWTDGKIKPVVDSTWALEDIVEGMQKMHARKNIGKIVLDLSLEPKPKPATPAKGKAKEDKKKQNSEEKKEEEKKEKKENGEKKDDSPVTNGEAESKENETS